MLKAYKKLQTSIEKSITIAKKLTINKQCLNKYISKLLYEIMKTTKHIVDYRISLNNYGIKRLWSRKDE